MSKFYIQNKHLRNNYRCISICNISYKFVYRIDRLKTENVFRKDIKTCVGLRAINFDLIRFKIKSIV